MRIPTRLLAWMTHIMHENPLFSRYTTMTEFMGADACVETYTQECLFSSTVGKGSATWGSVHRGARKWISKGVRKTISPCPNHLPSDQR